MSDKMILQDGGEQTIVCDCGKHLMHYRVYALSQKTTKVMATCPWCKATTYPLVVNGEFLYGPIGDDENRTATLIEDIEYLNNEAKFIIRKK